MSSEKLRFYVICVFPRFSTLITIRAEIQNTFKKPDNCAKAYYLIILFYFCQKCATFTALFEEASKKLKCRWHKLWSRVTTCNFITKERIIFYLMIWCQAKGPHLRPLYIRKCLILMMVVFHTTNYIFTGRKIHLGKKPALFCTRNATKICRWTLA